MKVGFPDPYAQGRIVYSFQCVCLLFLPDLPDPEKRTGAGIQDELKGVV